ncbi:tubulin/FtsZ family protein [Halorarius halobius]|uniref:tubulin/FtsZ family protein n=1 Tax=Halorarius halobius TaxID=2962671 RepID=UPI0020CE2735|nr:tubulin/FtsZ family protein [Halorarius halobius]
MRLAFVGVGQAGGKVVDAFLEFQQHTPREFVASAAAINTAHSDLLGLEYVPEQHRTLIGQARVKGHGVGADNELGAEIAQQNRESVLGALDSVPIGEVDAFLVVAALGGGTGSGAAPVIARYLREVYTEPVYGLGILPASNEGGIYTLNAARSFKTFARQADNLLVFDNDAWRKSAETLSDSYGQLNREIARRFGTLFSAGEVDATSDVAESVVDASEIINTLDTGGVSSVGYATQALNDQRGLLDRFRNGSDVEDPAADTNRITGLVRRATLGRLTLPCDVKSTERALMVVAGPRRHLDRQGIEEARRWLESETGTMEVRGGDFPIQSSELSAVVMLSGVSKIPRIDRLQTVALETQDVQQDTRERHEHQLDDLLTDERDELDPLF